MAQVSLNNTVTSVNEPGGSENVLLWITGIYPFFIIILSVTCRSTISGVIQSLPLAESASPGTTDDSPTGGKANPCLDDSANSNSPAEKPRTESMNTLEATQNFCRCVQQEESLFKDRKTGASPHRETRAGGHPATIKYKSSRQAFYTPWWC